MRTLSWLVALALSSCERRAPETPGTVVFTMATTIAEQWAKVEIKNVGDRAVFCDVTRALQPSRNNQLDPGQWRRVDANAPVYCITATGTGLVTATDLLSDAGDRGAADGRVE